MNFKYFLTILLSAVSIKSVQAQHEEKLVINAGVTKHILISGNLDIVLVPGYEHRQSVLVDPSVSEKISLNFTDNTLAVAPVNVYPGKRYTVYLHVAHLRSLTVEDDATIRTVGVINAPDLDLLIGGDARVHLKTNGIVKPQSTSGTGIKVKYLSENGVARQSLTKIW